MFQRMISKPLILLLVLSHLQLISCDNEDPTSPDEEQPGLPPAATMTIDLSYFSGQTQKADQVQQLTHFQQAGLRVLVINAAMIVIMALPTAVFALAASQSPEFRSDGKWHWTYTYAENGQNIQAELVGWIDISTQETVWEMYVTNPNATPAQNNFLWYEGRASLVDSTGYWDIYDATKPDSSINVLRINWDYRGENDAQLVFTGVKPNDPANGDMVTYIADGDNRSVQHFDNSESRTVDITWDKATGGGSLMDPQYNNGEQACWSGAQGHPNVDCN